MREDEPADRDGEDAAERDIPFRLGPPNRGRHLDPAPVADGFRRRDTATARHQGRPNNDRG